jgi:putative aldouronate transport system permease protein
MKKKSKKGFLSQWQLWVMLLPGLICLIVFHYIPMYGVTIAFKDLHIGDSLFGGQWVGFKHFIRLFDSDIFPTILKNTLSITMIKNFLLWPIPIIFALIVHNCRNNAVRKTTQTLSYIPYLMSMVVVVSLLELLCNRETGIINVLLQKLGMDSVYFFGENKYFLPMYLISDVWQTMGSSAVIYIAALSAVDPQLVEAAKIDGATKLQRIWYIDLPTIRPTIVILLIMNMGKILSIGYEKVLLMQNDLNLEASEIIGTYVYKSGLVSMQYSFSAAVSLFNNVVGLILLIVANQLAKKATDSALF